MHRPSNHIDQELLTKYLMKEVSEEEILKVEEWIKASDENKVAFERLTQVWLASEAIKDFEKIDVDADWQKVKSRVNFEGGEKVRRLYSMETHSYFSLFSRIAAVLVLVTGITLYLYQIYGNKEIVALTKTGENKEVQLPDGTTIFLNANSRIAYREDFLEDREVSLQGEAFFNVVKNADSPFKVRTSNTITEVLGTTFNVNDFQEKVIVTLISGKVAFYAEEKQSEKTFLEKGEQAVYDNGSISKETTKDQNVLAWKAKQIVFEDEKLSTVLDNLENYFKIQIEVTNPQLLNCRYTGIFKQPELQKVLNIIEATFDGEVVKRGETYVFNGQGCSD